MLVGSCIPTHGSRSCGSLIEFDTHSRRYPRRHRQWVQRWPHYGLLLKCTNVCGLHLLIIFLHGVFCTAWCVQPSPIPYSLTQIIAPSFFVCFLKRECILRNLTHFAFCKRCNVRTSQISRCSYDEVFVWSYFSRTHILQYHWCSSLLTRNVYNIHLVLGVQCLFTKFSRPGDRHSLFMWGNPWPSVAS